jgi:hypothetical protein
MSQPYGETPRTDDLRWAVRRPRGITCFYCGTPEPAGVAILGLRNRDGGGTEIAVCAQGAGCQDGRIYHGTQAEPHWPDQPCGECARQQSTKTGRLMAGNKARRSSRGGNRSDRHR